jgi:hypothetical protein
MNGKFDPEGTLNAEHDAVTVTGPISIDPGAKVDLLVAVIYEDTGEIAIGTANGLDHTHTDWKATLAPRDGVELKPTSKATGWAAASVVTYEGDDPAYQQWRVSTYSWDVPIAIVESQAAS